MTEELYCPNSQCKNHKHPPQDGSWMRKKGFLASKRDGNTQRFQCKECHRTFGLSYFSINHYVHRKLSYPKLLNHLASGSGIRDMARSMKCSPTMITHRLQRLSERVTSVCAEEIDALELIESVAADGLENFILSQYFPTNLNVMVGRRSQFIYTFNAFHFRRKGVCTEEQKETMKELYELARFEEKGSSKRFREILDFLTDKAERSSMESFILDTDEHPVYAYQFKHHPSLSPKIIHRTTNSLEERNYQNKLFPCNYIDRQIRKDLAEYIRETVQFGRNMNNSMDRFSCYSFWHNFIKPYRINKPKGKYKYHSHAAGFTLGQIKDIVHRVFHGVRQKEEDFMKYLTVYQKAHWHRELVNPLCCKAV